MMFLALKTEDGRIKGKIAFYCRMLGVSRQGFYKYLANKDRPWKYQDLADVMKEICHEDECNDTYGRIPDVSGAAPDTSESVFPANGLCTESWIRSVLVIVQSANRTGLQKLTGKQ